MTTIQSGKGFYDLFPPKSDQFTAIENTARDVFSRYGCRELRTPLVEYTELFVRGIGDETDVVQKEMYSFPDRKGRSLTLRPEATAGVLRACIEHKLLRKDEILKFFTLGPMFRYERPQMGRQRQFHQINVEILGSASHLVDVDMLFMLHRFLSEIGLTGLEYELNSLGCPQCRPAFRSALDNYLKDVQHDDLCADCQRRMHTNPLRVLDCKVPGCREIAKNAPVITQNNCEPCRVHFDAVVSLLDRSLLKVNLNPLLVRGLDYYQGTTFEVVSTNIGSQSSVAGGGRYDGLISQLGGPDMPGIGFACGLERLVMLAPAPSEPGIDVYITMHSDSFLEQALEIAQVLRAAHFSVEFPYVFRSLKSQMRSANKLNARYSIMLDEASSAQCELHVKDMSNGEQFTLSGSELPLQLRKRMGASLQN
ncbi:histidyl-tRNA synthetase [Desulfonatronum thiosulfatophilum]|uniref:Histidine--tRNA ligase n=1 Tax=Desulfonatronum thiosulfatophilum TaxID=617002 RepID=A0A1G6B7P4_9BACT|nr:histidine--tRNA ligase [Desulfonatronum thiosulfatophilum]SDB16423.1 histidyl-tRNA synthetase [Desulfonatronum thiosulfatophilum]